MLVSFGCCDGESGKAASTDDVGTGAGGQQLAVGAPEFHASTGHAGAQTQHFGAQFEVVADAGAQVVDAQVDGAELGEAVQALLGRLVHVAGTDGGHDGQAAHGVQPGADDAAVHPVVAEVPHQFAAHVDAGGDMVRVQAGDLQAQHLVEDDPFFKDGLEALDEGGLEFGGGGCGVRGFGHGVVGFRWMLSA